MIQSRIKNIIENNRYLTLATASEKGEPWISPLFFSTDKRGTFYWYSPVEARHSQYIEENPKVAITIYNTTASPDKVDAVYIEARAKKLGRAEILKVLPTYVKKSIRWDGLRLVKRAGDFLGKSPLRMYKAIPKEYSVLGEAKYYKDKFLDSREKG